MRPGGDEEGGKHALGVAEVVLPGVSAPAGVLEPDSRQELRGLMSLELGREDVGQDARLNLRRCAITGGRAYPGWEYLRSEPQILHANPAHTVKEPPHSETVKRLQQPRP